MRWITTIIIAALMFPVGASADVFVKQSSHTDGYYRGGTTTPPVDTAVEMWIGDERMAYITDSFKLIVDTGKKSMVFVNRRDNTFVETTLPLDKSKLFSEEDLGTLQVFQRVGEVKQSDATKKIDKWKCTGYEFHDWIPFEGGRVSEREVRSWVTADVPFDLEKLKGKLATLSSIGNLSDDYAKKRMAVSGFEVASEETTYNEGVAVTTTTTVVEMIEKEPPPEAYGVPEGCTKKDTLTLADLRG